MASPTPLRHFSALSYSLSSDLGLCGGRRAPGVGVVKNRRQTNCPECIRLLDGRPKGVTPKRGDLRGAG